MLHKNAIQKIDTAIRFFLYLLIFWLPYSKAVVESSVVTALILWLVKKVVMACFAQRSNPAALRFDVKYFILSLKPRPNFLNGPIGIFLVFALVSTVMSVSFWESIQGFVNKTLEWFIIYFLMIEVFTERKYVYRVIYVFLFTSLATVLDSLSQFYWIHKDIFLGYTMSDNRATAGFNHGNDLAGYLTFVVPLTLSLSFGKKEWKTILGVLGTLVSMWSLFVTFSRGGWVATIWGIFFFLILMGRTRRHFISFGVILFVIWLGISFTIPRKELRLDNLNVHITVDYRESLWHDSWRMILNRPGFGYGPNTYMSTFVDFGRSIRGGNYYKPTYAHNCFIQLAAEFGLVGLTCFLWILGQFFIKIMQQLKNSRESFEESDRGLQFLSAGLLSGTLAFLLHSCVDTNLFSLQLSALFWYMVGLQGAIYQVQTSFLKK